jgi:hypothetical protein
MFTISMNTPLVVAAIWNIIRNISIGSLMMPLLTWGTSNLNPKKVADATSLLSSFRTIAGSIGSAVFVAIMSAVQEASAGTYGDNAPMHGMNIAFACMAITAVPLLLLALFGVKDRKYNF